MREMTRVYLLDDEGKRFFGEGPYRLLTAVKEYGSLRAAAVSMGMAHTKALRLLHQAEQAMGVPLTVRATGGKDGGGSRLTPEGEELLQRYAEYRDRCVEANRRIYLELFSGAE